MSALKMPPAEMARQFKLSICAVFCDKAEGKHEGCRGCPARDIDAVTYRHMTIGDIIQPHRRKRRKAK